MDITVFQQACNAYRAGDFQKALSCFVSCSYDIDSLPDAEKVKFLRLLGNCYLKTDNLEQAIKVYSRAYAQADEATKPNICTCMGGAFLGLREYQKAIDSLEEALKSPEYKTPYKAYNAIASAQFCLENWEAAGAAWRKAALDEKNPKPALALVNLGLCFMKLSRPADAIISYETALDLGLDGTTLCETQANLGQAYVVEGRIKRAIAAFDAASKDDTYHLSEMAAHDYELAKNLEKRLEAKVPHIFDTASFPAVQLVDSEEEDINALASSATAMQAKAGNAHSNKGAAQGGASSKAAGGEDSADQDVNHNGEHPSQSAANGEYAEDDSGEFDPLAPSDYFYNESAYAHSSALSQSDSFYDDETSESPSLTGDIPNPNQSGFFDISEDYINSQAIESRRKARHAHGVGLKIAIGIVILLIVLVGAAIGAYALGYGYPTAESVATEFFNAAQNQKSTDAYWDSSVDSDSRTSELATLTGVSGCTIESIQRNMSQTIVYVKSTLKEGGDIYYELELARNNIGWKVKYLGLYFPSKG